MRTLPLVLLVVSCAKDADRDKDKQPAVEDPSPYVVDETSSPVPTADLAEIGSALQAGIEGIVELGAPPIRDAYNTVMTESSLICPGTFSGPDGDYWFDDCTAASGATFTGYAFAYEAYDLVDPYYGLTYDTWYVFGAATLFTSTGQMLEIGGGATLNEYSDGVYTQWDTSLQGSFAWDGVGATGTWLEEGLDPDLFSTFIALPSLNQNGVYFDGGVGGLGPQAQWAVGWDTAALNDPLFGSSCQDEPMGEASVRAADGSWYDIRFHGSDEYGNTTGPCDGCGDVFFQGEAMGEVCADFSSWLGWGDSPW